MELQSIMLSEMSQSETNTIVFHSYVEFNKQNKWAKGKREKKNKKQTLNYGEQTDGYQRRGGWEVG